MHARSLLVVLTSCASALAQNYAYSPAGTQAVEGSDNNTIPLWSDSATYMQIHDHENMVATLGGQATNLLGLTLRKDRGGAAVLGRTLTLQMTASATTVTTRSATNSFAGNLGPGATVVLPYGQISFPTLIDTGVPNPPGIVLPWTAPFSFQPSPGTSLCWEWRHHSATSRAIGALDAVNANNAQIFNNEGTGCTAGGQFSPAAIDLNSLDLLGQNYRNRLVRGAATAGAVFVLGGQRLTLQLPGQCAPVLTNPLAFVPGSTDSAGTWDLSFATPDLRAGGRAEIFGQFVWIDASLPLGLGVSDMSVAVTPFRGSYYMARFYSAPYNGGAGFENATFASGNDVGYGLVVGFMTP